MSIKKKKKKKTMSRVALNIGMVGCGTVGGGVYELLHNPSRLSYFKSIGVNAVISRICVRDLQRKRDFEYFNGNETTYTSNPREILEDPKINCVLELMGGVSLAKDIVFEAIRKGKHVITANKALVANHMSEILKLLEEHPEVRFGYEATVCGGIPIIHTMQSAYPSDEIAEIAGIMNGTTNYMLSKMEGEGVAYDAVLKEAQDLGYAEADPSADVDGFDVQSKIAILTKLGFGSVVEPKEIPTTGISRITSVDFEYSKMMNSTIKLLGVAKQLEESKEGRPGKVSVYVSPVVVPLSNVIGTINGATNLVSITSKNLLSSSYVGEGAGRFPTANSVMNDVIQLARGQSPTDPFMNDAKMDLENDYSARFYVRIKIRDQVGVIRSVGELAEKAGVSIYSILQSPISDPNDVDFVVTTDVTHLSNVKDMCQKIKELPFVKEEPLHLPIL